MSREIKEILRNEIQLLPQVRAQFWPTEGLIQDAEGEALPPLHQETEQEEVGHADAG